MSPTNRVTRFLEPVDPPPVADPVMGIPITPAEHPEPSESRWQPAAAHGCSETELPTDMDRERALYAWQVTQEIVEALNRQVGDLFELHAPPFEEIYSRGLAVEQIELSGGPKEFISGVKLENAPCVIASELRAQAQRLHAAARLLEHAIQTGEW